MIHKGKVIHPARGGNASDDEHFDDVSEQLLDISAADIIHRKKKPSLVVMGPRKQTTSSGYHTTFGAIVFIANRLSPWYFFRVMTYGFRWTVRAVSTVADGVFLFLRSLLYPPQTQV